MPLISLYQAVCFEIPKMLRASYFIYSASTPQLLNSSYGSYANALIAYVAEITGRTKRHWCLIKHNPESLSRHSRYIRFLPYGDAAAHREQLEEVRNSFHDLKP
jgi:hypothetical protein